MRGAWQNRQAQWEDWVNAVLGAWLAISPWVLALPAIETAATWNSYIVGIAIFCVAVLALVQFRVWEEWINCILGLWLIVSPWLLGYSDITAVMWNHVIVGILVAAVALIEIRATRPSRQAAA